MTSTDPIPDHVKRFILVSVPSVPYLEAMLLFRREAHASLGASDVAARLYLPESKAVELIGQLADSRVIAAAEGAWRYGPDGPPLAAIIDDLADAYAGNLVGVAKLIHATSERRATQFADAFRIRKES